MSSVYDLPPDSSERTLVLTHPTIGNVLNGIRQEFEKIVDGRITRVLVVFSSVETETPEVAETMRGLVMRFKFRLEKTTQRYTALERRFEPPARKRRRPATAESIT